MPEKSNKYKGGEFNQVKSQDPSKEEIERYEEKKKKDLIKLFKLAYGEEEGKKKLDTYNNARPGAQQDMMVDVKKLAKEKKHEQSLTINKGCDFKPNYSELGYEPQNNHIHREEGFYEKKLEEAAKKRQNVIKEAGKDVPDCLKEWKEADKKEEKAKDERKNKEKIEQEIENAKMIDPNNPWFKGNGEYKLTRDELPGSPIYDQFDKLAEFIPIKGTMYNKKHWDTSNEVGPIIATIYLINLPAGKGLRYMVFLKSKEGYEFKEENGIEYMRWSLGPYKSDAKTEIDKHEDTLFYYDPYTGKILDPVKNGTKTTLKDNKNPFYLKPISDDIGKRDKYKKKDKLSEEWIKFNKEREYKQDKPLSSFSVSNIEPVTMKRNIGNFNPELIESYTGTGDHNGTNWIKKMKEKMLPASADEYDILLYSDKMQESIEKEPNSSKEKEAPKETVKAVAVPDTKKDEKAPESKDGKNWEGDGLYHYIPKKDTPFSNKGLIVYVKEIVQKKYKKDKYYVVFRTDGNIHPKFSLPLFMTEEEWKKGTFGTFEKEDPDDENIKKKTGNFEEYLKSEGNAAINAIVNKKRVLGLSRMLVGNINKGGKRTRRKRNNKRKTKRRV